MPKLRELKEAASNGDRDAQLILQQLTEEVRQTAELYRKQAARNLWESSRFANLSVGMLSFPAMSGLTAVVKRAIKLNLSPAVEAAVNQMHSSLRRAVEPLVEAFKPGNFWGDLYLVESGSQREQEEALKRLVSKRFTRGVVFHNKRWRLLEPYFQERRRDRSFEATWEELAMPALFIAIMNVPDELFVDEVPQWLRREMRKEIEKDLLGGKTLDQKQDEPLPEEYNPEAARLDKESLIEAKAIRNALLSQVGTLLSQQDIEILLAERGDVAALAQRYHMSEANIRKKRQRLLGRLRRVYA